MTISAKNQVIEIKQVNRLASPQYVTEKKGETKFADPEFYLIENKIDNNLTPIKFAWNLGCLTK